MDAACKILLICFRSNLTTAQTLTIYGLSSETRDLSIQLFDSYMLKLLNKSPVPTLNIEMTLYCATASMVVASKVMERQPLSYVSLKHHPPLKLMLFFSRAASSFSLTESSSSSSLSSCPWSASRSSPSSPPPPSPDSSSSHGPDTSLTHTYSVLRKF